MSWTKFLRKYIFTPQCLLFELQKPDFVWDSEILGPIAYKIHLWTCPEMLPDTLKLLVARSKRRSSRKSVEKQSGNICLLKRR